MVFQDYLIIGQFLVALFLSIEASLHLILRYRTRLAVWCGLVLLSLAVDLGCYLLQIANPLSPWVSPIFLVQCTAYSLFCIAWLIFVLIFTRHGDWIKPQNLALICLLPAVYLSMIAVRWAQGLPGQSQDSWMVGSLMQDLPMTAGLPGILFLIFGYGVALLTILLLVQYYFRSKAPTRVIILPLMVGPIVLSVAGFLEQAGFNPLYPFSIQQLVCSAVSYLAFWIILDLRFGSILSHAREKVVDQMQDGVLILDQQDRIVDLNPSAQQILGVSRQDAIKQPLARIWPVAAGLLTGQSMQEPVTSENSIVINGFESTIDIIISQLFDAYREAVGRLVVLRNVTGRERMETALNERSRELQRTNTFLAALATATVNLQKTMDSSRVMEVVGNDLASLGLSSFFADFDPATNELVTSHVQTNATFVPKIEKFLGARLIGYHLARERFPWLYSLLDGAGNGIEAQLFEGLGSLNERKEDRNLRSIVDLVGIGVKDHTILVPLVAGERILGLMGVWGADLRKTDVSPLNMFANQIAWAIERSARYETELQRSADLARVNNLVLALSNMAAHLSSNSNSETVLDVLGRELLEAGLKCAVVTIDPVSEAATVKYVSFSPKLLRALEKLIGIQVKNHVIPKRYWPGDRILRERSPIWYPQPVGYFRRLFPQVPDAVADQASKLLGFRESDQVCILPLVSGERTIGAMPIWGTNINPSDNPILSVFGSQVAGILQNMTSYEYEAQRAGNLARSNAMIIALSNVAARLETTSKVADIFETLGRELGKVKINCMVGTLDDDQQNLTIEYLSIPPEVITWAEKLGIRISDHIRIPRRLWPTDTAITQKAPFWDPDPIGSTRKMLPFIPKNVISQAFKLAGMNPDDRMCYLPMVNEENVIGILAVWGQDMRRDDISALSVFANQVATAIKNATLYNQAQKEIVVRTETEARIQEALNEKEVLLKEIHHRVKNNLQVISSLLSLQMSQSSDANASEVLRESQSRVRAMALIHEKLYQSEDLARIDFSRYLHSLTNALVQTYRLSREKVSIQVSAGDILLDLDTAIPCGLIVNELVTNSLKYAFPEGYSGVVEVCFDRQSGERYTLVVADNGVGLPPGFEPLNTPSLGLKLVTSLVKQIGGSLQVAGGRGTKFEISFSKAKETAEAF